MRQPKPYLRKQTGSWYVQLDGKQHPLGANKAAAWQKYHELMAKRPNPADLPGEAEVAGLLIRFLEWCKRNQAEGADDFYQGFIDPFCRFLVRKIGEHAPVSAVKPHHVTEWLDSKGKTWNATTRYDAIRAVKRPFNWGCDEGYIDVSPIRKVKRGRPKRRETIISDIDWQRIMAVVPESDPFRDYLTFLRETGWRPQEVRAIEARHFNREQGLVQFPADEESKSGIPRTIYLNETALAIVERRALSGHVFRNRRGNPWKKYAIVKSRYGIIVCYMRSVMAAEGFHGFLSSQTARKRPLVGTHQPSASSWQR